MPMNPSPLTKLRGGAPQLTHDVVATLSKRCNLVSFNCTLSQRRDDVTNVVEHRGRLEVAILRFVDVVPIHCHNVAS